jgi:hypothetical protein
MQFRWIALMALWTILSGPIFGGPSGAASRVKETPHTVSPAKPMPAKPTPAKPAPAGPVTPQR